MRSGFVAALVALGCSLANASMVFEALSGVPEGWERVREAADARRMQFRIAMNEPVQGLLEQTLYRISDPNHADYGKHLKREELKALLRPDAEATHAVMSWLKEYVPEKDIVDDGEWIEFMTDVGTAEKLLATQFDVYRNKAINSEKIRTLSYSVPEAIQKYISMIQPTTRFFEPRAQASQIFRIEPLDDALTQLETNIQNTAAVPAACGTAITPACLQSLYNIKNVPKINSKTKGFAAFNNFLEQYPRYADLAMFENVYAPYAKGANFTVEEFNGGKNDQNYNGDSGEANLDAQYLLGIGYPVPIKAYSTGGRGPLVPDNDQPTQPGNNEPYMDVFKALLAKSDDELPHTLTTSYGENEQSVPLSYRLSVCNMIAQLGARGVSVLFSSGDTGVGSACQSNDGKNTTEFNPTFPAGCPYVTSVGATGGVNPEKAVSFSSGGFSITWARPSYQDNAVPNYLKGLGDKFKGLYNASGRGIPDVSAQGVRFHVFDKGVDQLISGTSASSPAFAGVVALLNELRIQDGKKPLGFLNPFLYSKGVAGLNDITSGGSTGCTGTDIYSGVKTPYVAGASWNATKGWDPVTGLGTPDFTKLRNLTSNA